MARLISWLPRLHEIRRAVANSVRSHYGRREIERLFELQPRAAQKLIEMLPSTEIGTSRLIDREVLSGFLDRVRDTDDTSTLFQELKQKKAAVSRRKPRSLVRRDSAWAGVSSLPDSLRLKRGRLEVDFRTVEELAEAMYSLARILQDDSEAFADAFEPAPELVAAAEEPDECQVMFAELEELEAKGVVHL